MPDTPERDRRRWADVIVIATGLLLVGLAAWNAPASSSPRQSIASLGSMYVAYGVGGVLTLVALFVAHRSATAGRVLLGAAALLVLGFGLAAFREPTAALWLTIVVPAALLLAATPFFGPLPRARPTA